MTQHFSVVLARPLGALPTLGEDLIKLRLRSLGDQGHPLTNTSANSSLALLTCLERKGTPAARYVSVDVVAHHAPAAARTSPAFGSTTSSSAIDPMVKRKYIARHSMEPLREELLHRAQTEKILKLQAA